MEDMEDMEDNLTNIETVIKIIKKEKEPEKEMNFRVLKEEESPDGLKIYEVEIYKEEYEIIFPAIKFIYGEQKKEIHSTFELNVFLNGDDIKDKFFKLEGSECVFSIKDSEFSIMEHFQFGSTYYILENKKTKEITTFTEFLEKSISSKFFPDNCKYYKLYCKNTGNFRYIKTIKRSKFEGNLENFIYNNDKKKFLTGQRGIGKTTTILRFFYKRNYPFFYINLKYFEKSTNELEQSQILNFEKNNLFKYLYLNLTINLYTKQNNYDIKIIERLKEIKDFTFNSNDNINIIEFVTMIIDILSLIYGYIRLYKESFRGNNKIMDNIKSYINEIIEKIKLLNINEKIVKDDEINPNDFMENKKLLRFITLLSKYKSYKSYLVCNKDLTEYKFNNIFEYIEYLLNKCNKLKLDFILILDQYKNISNNKTKLDKIINQINNSKLIVCSSIDDYETREALINGNPPYIYYQESFITLEDIKKNYPELFRNISDKKRKIIDSYANSNREIFECLNKNDDNLENYNKKKIEKIINNFELFCKGNLSRISYINFLFRNIDFYWEEDDYKEIRKFIPFKYFNFKKIQSTLLSNKDNIIGKLEKENEVNENSSNSEIITNKHEVDYYYKIDYSMPIVENSLYQFIRNETNIKNYEEYIRSSSKGAGKGITFEEYIKSKIIKGLIIPIKGMKIDESVEIWSLFSKPSLNDIPGLFENKLEKNKIYFIDMRNEREPMFDCAIIDLIKNKILLIQITISKVITEDVFKRDKIEEKGKEILEFLKGNLIDENIKLDICFFFIFLKYEIDEVPVIMDEKTEKMLYYMKKINRHLEKMTNKCKSQNLNYIIYHLENFFTIKNIKPKIEYNQIEENDQNLYILKKEERELNNNQDLNSNEDIKTNDDIKDDIKTNELFNNNVNNTDSVNVVDENLFINQDININNNNIYNNNINNNNIYNDNIQNNNNIYNNIYKERRTYEEMILNSNDSNYLVEVDLEKNQGLKNMYYFYINNFKIFGGKIYKDKRPHSFNDIEIFCKKMNCFATFVDDEEENFATNIIYYEEEICITNIINNKKLNMSQEFTKFPYTLYFIGNIKKLKLKIDEIESQEGFENNQLNSLGSFKLE